MRGTGREKEQQYLEPRSSVILQVHHHLEACQECKLMCCRGCSIGTGLPCLTISQVHRGNVVVHEALWRSYTNMLFW